MNKYRLFELIALWIVIVSVIFLLLPTKPIPAAAVLLPSATMTATCTVEPTGTNTPTLTSTATSAPTQTLTATPVPWTPEPKVYPSPTGMQCEVEQQWGRGEGHDFAYGCFALSCGFADGTAYGNNLVCLTDKSIGTPWPYEWSFYHPLIEQLTK